MGREGYQRKCKLEGNSLRIPTTTAEYNDKSKIAHTIWMVSILISVLAVATRSCAAAVSYSRHRCHAGVSHVSS